MAPVFLAEDLKHARKVAIKAPKPELSATLGRDPFMREIEIVATLSHPHMLTLIDSDAADGFLYYFMPTSTGAPAPPSCTRVILAIHRALRAAAPRLQGNRPAARPVAQPLP